MGSAKITEQYETELTITWNKVEGADGYEVYYRGQVPGEDKWEPWFLVEKTKKTTAQSFIIDGEFQMRVRAYKGSTKSGYTETITVLGGKGITSGPKAGSAAKLNKTKANLNVGSTLQLSVKNTKDKITWKSSDKKIATVTSKGLVKGIKQGEAKITATMGKKKLTCKITVKKSTKKDNSKMFDSYKKILNKNISEDNAFALLDMNKDGQKELILSIAESAASSDWKVIVYSYYKDKQYESTIPGQSDPTYISDKKGIVAGQSTGLGEMYDIYVLKKGVLKSIYNSGSSFNYSNGENIMVVNGKTVSVQEREKADKEAGINSGEEIKLHTVTKDNIKKYVK